MQLKVTDATGRSELMTAPITTEEVIPTAFGNTSRTSENPAGVAEEDAYYGVVAPWFRFYFSGAMGTLPTSDRKYFASFKTYNGGGSAEIALIKVPERVTYIHEINKKVKAAGSGGAALLADWKSKMLDMQSKGVTNLVIVLTAGIWVDSTQNPEDYIIPGIPWTIDYDGVSFSNHYHDYTPEWTAMLAFMAAHPDLVIEGVAEFGACRATATDADDSVRAAWLRAWADLFAAQPWMKYVLFWENSSLDNSEFLMAATKAVIVDYISR